ncbi:MAG: nitroreductase [Proteobacteria bacterium]|nr:nitroreductase [Pseudomonadota bacterium]
MDVAEAIKIRKSVRKFKSDPVPKAIIKELLDISVRSPSANNTQPWGFTIITGDILEKIRKENVENLRNGQLPSKEMERLLVVRPKGSVYRKRQVEIAKQLFRLMEIPREDKEKRTEWMERGFRYFDAPCVIIITADKWLPLPGTFFDNGCLAQTICLAALSFGLHTCIENQGVTYAEVLRKHASISDDKQIITAIAIGYPDWDFPANKVESTREPIDNIAEWVGF